MENKTVNAEEFILKVVERMTTLEIQNQLVRDDIHSIRKGLEKILDDHEGRIRKIEHSHWKVQGIAASVAAVASWIMSKLT